MATEQQWTARDEAELQWMQSRRAAVMAERRRSVLDLAAKIRDRRATSSPPPPEREMTDPAKSVALHLWRKDGEPERDPRDPSTAGRGDYDNWSRDVVRGLREIGYKIVKGDTTDPETQS